MVPGSSPVGVLPMMGRRRFTGLLGGAAVAWPLAARAQQPAKIWRIGIVVEGMRSPAYDGFLQGMDELGYVAGKDYLIEWRFPGGRELRTRWPVREFPEVNNRAIFPRRPATDYLVAADEHTVPSVQSD